MLPLEKQVRSLATHTHIHTHCTLNIHTHCTLNPTDPTPPRHITITRVFQGGFELNWLPPTEPNGEVHYVIEYKREDSGNWTSVNTTSDSTHYNLTGLHSGTNYTIRVAAVNSAGRAIIRLTVSSTATSTASSTATPTASSTATSTASSTATPTASSTATPTASSKYTAVCSVCEAYYVRTLHYCLHVCEPYCLHTLAKSRTDRMNLLKWHSSCT